MIIWRVAGGGSCSRTSSPGEAVTRIRSLEKWREKLPNLRPDRRAETVEDALGILTPGEGLTLAERYARGDLQIWCELGIRVCVDNLERYLIVFEYFPDGNGNCVGSHSGMQVPLEHIGGSGDQEQLPVLVDYVKLAEHPESFPNSIPSVVRLYRLNDLENIPADAPGYIQRLGSPRPDEAQDLALGSRALSPDGELGVIGGPIPADPDKLTREVIHGGPEVVNAVPDDCGP